MVSFIILSRELKSKAFGFILNIDMKKAGFTLMELLIVIAIIGILFSAMSTNWFTQYKKGFDTRRKSDLSKIRTALEHYANDHGCYPPVVGSNSIGSCSSTIFNAYNMPKLLCDPETKQPYYYETVGGNPCAGYYLYTSLKWTSDPDIERIGCDAVIGCNVLNRPDLNYGLSSGMPVNR